MHPSTALATVLVDELVRGGVREAVLAPGSRSAPLAYALEEADRAGRLRLHVRVDERSAGFLALGLARGSGLPVPVVTTSGTAVANLHPAVLEAHHSGIPLLVLSADRPAELRGTGANQTTVQPGIFAAAVRWEADLPAPESVSPVANAHWRSTVCRALAAALDPTGVGGRGPIHLNVSFRDPLAPDLGSTVEAQEGREGGGPWTEVPVVQVMGGPSIGAGERTLVLLGDLPDPALSRQALEWAGLAGWPVLAEPFGVLPAGGTVVPHGVLVAGRLAAGDPGLSSLVPDRVVVVGRLTLFRELGALLRRPGTRVEHVSPGPRWTDPSHVVARVHRELGPPPGQTPGADAWVAAWVDAGRALDEPVRAAVGEGLTGPGVAVTVAAALGDEDVLVLGSSNAPRDLALAHDATWPSPRVVAGRGLAGIDGTVSTAVGVALATGSGKGTGRTVALMGDLTFLHDANGLVIGPTEPRPDLTIVVTNDDGGGIFSTLEYGEPARSAAAEAAAATERIFGTPHGTDLGALCAAHHVPFVRVTDLAALRSALEAQDGGLRVVEVPLDRTGHRPLRDRLRG
ncbi:2-succinyl-5-enolpyruvyl-6-hydroxy-3-cyclohexene-1-carboxylic-acid synthase [Ornithinimicrobium panacihumi]|uniref:2-succinyl-5-enolpyruvyl-6-hydroxy-3- cyclohexene-1-carboxylic-acid synthase n=1 Tax=Ornithinimicrobium panacihumi TaxID=2008449 RepID=UPI003F8BF64A